MTDNQFDPSNISGNESQHYHINTGHIFSELQERWQQFDRQFLAKELQNALLQTLHQKEVFQNLDLPGEQRREQVQKAERIYQQDLNRIATSETCFPFPDFSLAQKGGEQQIIDFGARCELSLEDQHFPLFFSLQLALTDVLEVHAFLDFHLRHTFYNEKEAMQEFLSNCQKKYPRLFNEKLLEEIDEYNESSINNSPLEASEEIEDDLEEGKNGITLNRQVLMMYFLMKKAGADRGTAAVVDMARFIQLVTGKQLGTNEVKNTNIYKRLSNPLKDVKKGGFQEDLIFVRSQFEKIGLMDVAEEISTHIHFRE